ncbi:MAG: hypothetical protein P4L50_03400 [Anaerolineaceae bacterium]|nr:hypothetical protein [Anaerolineaceae bacterium]
MTKGQLDTDSDNRQNRVEGALSTLGTTLALLEHDMIRVRQAIRRSGLTDLLTPVLDDYELLSKRIHCIQCDLRGQWDAGQKSRWKNGEQ